MRDYYGKVTQNKFFQMHHAKIDFSIAIFNREYFGNYTSEKAELNDLQNNHNKKLRNS